MSLVSFHYIDDLGQTYLILKRNLRNVFKRISDVDMEYKIIEINIKKNTATVTLDIRVIGTRRNNRGYIIGNFDNPERLILTFEKERLKWLLTRSEGIEGFYF